MRIEYIANLAEQFRSYGLSITDAARAMREFSSALESFDSIAKFTDQRNLKEEMHELDTPPLLPIPCNPNLIDCYEN